VYRQIYAVRAQCVAGKFVKLWGEDKIQSALERLERLTNVEDLADNLGTCDRAQQVSPLLT
jgi:hypothetical protein